MSKLVGHADWVGGRLAILFAGICIFCVGSSASLPAAAGSLSFPFLADKPSSATCKSRALILVGLPGDKDHEARFAATVEKWRAWLTGTLAFEQADVHVLFGREGKKDLAQGPATAEGIEKEMAALRLQLSPEDRLWVFFLGHADYDGEHAYFHLPGRDLNEKRLGRLFAGIHCREQVFWMTTAASGWFLKSLSAKNRIVITATAADEEFNETEFPEALATVCGRVPTQLDSNKDGRVSLLELFQHTVAEVKASFAADKRIPTEHAQLDDNGDGLGTEEPVLTPTKDKKLTADGPLAAKTFLPFKEKNAK